MDDDGSGWSDYSLDETMEGELLHLLDLAEPGSSKSRSSNSDGPRAHAPNNSAVRRWSFLFEAGCSTLPEVAHALCLLCICAALGVANGCCCSAPLCVAIVRWCFSLRANKLLSMKSTKKIVTS